jgi:uncharacterized damage-inducible protein DinB/putative sterol carrier protein
MLDTATLRRLFAYKAWANDAMLRAAQSFEPESPAGEVALRILAHTHVTDRIFAAHLTGGEHGYTSANPIGAVSRDELFEAMRASDAWYAGHAPDLGSDDPTERIDFSFTDGDPGRMSQTEMLMHVLIHGAYHRGQVAWIMGERGAAPPADGFTTYLHTSEAATRRRSNVATPNAPASAGRAGNVEPDQAERPETRAEAGSPLEAFTRRMSSAVSAGEALGKSLKFDLKGDGYIFIDGRSVTNEDKAADLTLRVSLADLRAIGQGKLAPTGAIMSGRLAVSDMGLAVALQGRMRALFSSLPD